MGWSSIVLLGTFIAIIFSLSFLEWICDLFNCQLSILDVTIEFFIALFMATFFVLAIEFHLTKFRFWKFCQIAYAELRVIPKKKIGPLKIKTSCPEKSDILKILIFIQSHENLLLDAASIEKSTAVRHRFAIFREGLEQKDIDLSCQVYTNLSSFMEKLLDRYKPPFYIMLAAKYFGGFRSFI